MPTYYEALPICRAAMDVAVRVDAVVCFFFERPLARECQQEESK
jgi:hypothetical protein